MADLTLRTVDISGLDDSSIYESAAAGGDAFVNDGRTIIHIKNGDASGMTLTMDTPGTYRGVNLANPTVSVGATSNYFVGAFDPRIFNDTNGKVQLTYSAVTSLTITALQITITGV